MLRYLCGISPCFQTDPLILIENRAGRPDRFFRMEGCDRFPPLSEASGLGTYSTLDESFPTFCMAKQNDFDRMPAALGIANISVALKDLSPPPIYPFLSDIKFVIRLGLPL